MGEILNRNGKQVRVAWNVMLHTHSSGGNVMRGDKTKPTGSMGQFGSLDLYFQLIIVFLVVYYTELGVVLSRLLAPCESHILWSGLPKCVGMCSVYFQDLVPHVQTKIRSF